MSGILLSVIVPAYNVEKYIDEAIKCVINQSYPNWELVIVDDCSNDTTGKVINDYMLSDNRIVYHKLEHNTGSAYVPRETAANLAKGEYVVLLDADDYFEDRYLEKISKKIKTTQADTILNKMYLLDEKGNFSGSTLPLPNFDETQGLTGKDALRYTVPWKIALGGAAFRRDLFLKTLVDHEGFSKGVYGDEFFCRHCLLNSNLVVFAGGKYYYRFNPDSVVHTFSPRIFQMQDSYEEVRDFFISQFGPGSAEHQNAERYMLSGLGYCFNQYLRGKDTLSRNHKEEFIDKFKKWYNQIDFRLINSKSKQEYLYALGFRTYYYISSLNFILRKWYHSLRK